MYTCVKAAASNGDTRYTRAYKPGGYNSTMYAYTVTRTHLHGGALVGEGRVEERGDDAHHCDSDVILEHDVSMLAIAGRVAHHGHVDEEVLEQLPHVVARVDLLHLNLGVDVAVIEEVHVAVLHLYTDSRDHVT